MAQSKKPKLWFGMHKRLLHNKYTCACVLSAKIKSKAEHVNKPANLIMLRLLHCVFFPSVILKYVQSVVDMVKINNTQ